MNNFSIFSALLLVCFFICDLGHGYIIPDIGSRFKPTKGEVWPKPRSQMYFNDQLSFDPNNFQFIISEATCDILDEAVKRYDGVLRRQAGFKRRSSLSAARSSRRRLLHHPRRSDEDLQQLTSLRVTLTQPCEHMPYMDMDEKYELAINMDSSSILRSDSVWGILRGLETFSQLIYRNSLLKRDLFINRTRIVDFPRFSYRSLLLDTSRHYISVGNIYAMLDGMAYNKLNAFHWHIVDDESFPYVSLTFPKLSEKASYLPTLIYTQADVANVIEYARIRGIRVIPEFDGPAHTRSWGAGYPELLTKCYDDDGLPTGMLGPIDPTNKTVYTFFNRLYNEIATVFPDQFIHIGGDEVDFECWQSNPEIRSFMQENSIRSFADLEELFIDRILNIARGLNKTTMVWHEVFVNGLDLPEGTIVYVWRDDDNFSLLNHVTASGKLALFSHCWYLDHLATGGDWEKFYRCDPQNFNGTAEQKKLVLGGGAFMWTEVVDNSNVLTRIFPRSSATAEKLWSDQSVMDVDEAKHRLEEHYCRMNKRGIPCQPPNGPGVCV